MRSEPWRRPRPPAPTGGSWSSSLRIDVFTLFPEWFDWFLSQRHVRNALGGGNQLRLFNYRDSTPLGGGQVDDSPCGGGAGMVLRVAAVGAAIGAAYADGLEPSRVL